MADLRDTVRVRGTIKSTRTSSVTGERTLTLSFSKSEAGKVAQLSLYDGIAFDVDFTPAEAMNVGKKAPRL